MRPGNRRALLLHWPGSQRYEALRVLRLSRAQIGDNRGRIVSERVGVGLPNGTNLVHDGVGHGRGHAGSSSGLERQRRWRTDGRYGQRWWRWQRWRPGWAGRCGYGRGRGRRRRRQRARPALVGVNAAADRAVGTSRAAIPAPAATVADGPAVVAALDRGAADSDAVPALDADVVLAETAHGWTRIPAFQQLPAVIRDRAAVPLPQRTLAADRGRAFLLAAIAARRTEPTGFGTHAAVQRSTAAVPNDPTASVRRGPAHEQLTGGRLAHADVILASPPGEIAVGPTMKHPETAIPDIAAVVPGGPVVTSEGQAGRVPHARPGGCVAPLSRAACHPTIERAAATISNLPAVVDVADGIVTADGDAAVRGRLSVDGPRFRSAGFDGQVLRLGGRVSCLGGQVGEIIEQPSVASLGGFVRG